MRLFRNREQAYQELGPDNDGDRVYVGYPALYNVYRFSWNTRTNEGVLNFQYHSCWGNNLSGRH